MRLKYRKEGKRENTVQKLEKCKEYDNVNAWNEMCKWCKKEGKNEAIIL